MDRRSRSGPGAAGDGLGVAGTDSGAAVIAAVSARWVEKELRVSAQRLER